MSEGWPVIGGLIGTGLPQPLLVPEQNEGWGRVREGYEKARAWLEELNPDVLIVYSTMWPSVIGHQIQADPEPTWTHVDELFHDLGSIPYSFKVDSDFAHEAQRAGVKRGLMSRTVSYHGFPIDTGSIVALKLLNPNNKFPISILSSNVYADRAETVVFAKSILDALKTQKKRAAVVTVASLSNRLFTDFIEPSEDRIHSAKDEEWNQKLLEFLGAGRLEDVAQLSREIQKQIRVKKVVNFKPFWFLSAMCANNNFDGEVYAYEPIYGTGKCLITPSAGSLGDKEFDEDDVEVFQGDRNVLGGQAAADTSESNSAVSDD